ncbi:MAG TPA: NAD(P)H-dependent oxidoreductase [Anaerolineaceae bacterium]|nr:NAD(P)H-dependent oxidoreductase [Anaerolineaceae bacterium]
MNGKVFPYMPTKIALVTGSLRKDANSKRLAKAFASLFPKEYQTFNPEIGHLPLYNQDYDNSPDEPESYADFRKEIASADGVIFITPEYNRGLPAVMKNAIDIASRPWGKNAWNGKPAVVISSSGGVMGGFGANHQLRQSLAFLNMRVLAQPEAYIGKAQTLVDEDGKILSEDTQKFFQSIVDGFVELIQD